MDDHDKIAGIIANTITSGPKSIVGPITAVAIMNNLRSAGYEIASKPKPAPAKPESAPVRRKK